MMPPPGLQIYIRPRVTLTFDLLTPKLTVSCPCPVDHALVLASKSVHLFRKYRVHKFVSRQIKERMGGQTNERTDGQIEKIMLLPPSLAWWRHTNSLYLLLYNYLQFAIT